MATDDPYAPSTSAPFGESPRGGGGGAGRAKPLLIGCGLLVVLAAVVLVVLVAKSTDLLVWGLARVERQVEETLPADIEPAERQRLAAAFEGARDAIRERRIDPVALERLQNEVLAVGRAAAEEGLDRDDVGRLIEALEGLATVGRTPPVEPAEPEAPAAERASPEPAAN